MNTMIGHISLDIETANLDMEAEGLKFDDPQGWKTAVVCVHVAPYHSVADPMDFIYVADNVLEEVRSKCPINMNQRIHPFSKFAGHLADWRDCGFMLLTHNGLGFDLPIISKSIKDGGLAVHSILESWPPSIMMDTCFVLKETTGVRYRLNHLIHGLLGEESSKLMNAANAPKEWAKKNYEEVIRYCIDDTRKTLAVYKTAWKEGRFRAIGKDEYADVPLLEYLEAWLKWQNAI